MLLFCLFQNTLVSLNPDILVDMEFDDWIINVGNCYKQLADKERNTALDYLIELSDTSQLYFLSKKLNCLLKRDFIVHLPRELSVCLLQYLDLRSLLNCCCVSRQWNTIVNSCRVIWRNLCLKSGVVLDCGDTETRGIKQAYLRILQRMKQLRQGDAFDSILLYGHTDRVMAVYYNDGKIATGRYICGQVNDVLCVTSIQFCSALPYVLNMDMR